MTAKKPIPTPMRSGYCEAAKHYTNPDDAHAACQLEGCDCHCHQPATSVLGMVERLAVAEARDRPKVPLACLQGRHTDTCGHAVPDELEPTGVQLAIENALTPGPHAGTDWKPLPADQLVRDLEWMRDHGDLSSDPHMWPVILFGGRQAGKTAAGEAFTKLTDEERRRVIAAHLKLDPASILETVETIIRERTTP